MIRRDMQDVLRIERESFEQEWSEDDFLNCLRQRNCIGMVAEHEGQVVGFMVYGLHKTRLQIMNFAVSPSCRRFGIGHQMIDKLVNKLSQQRRQEILVDLRESNLSAQLFFQAQRFRAVRVVRSHFDDTGEDAYLFAFRIDGDYQMQPTTRHSRQEVEEFDDFDEGENRAA
jgi:ribosomal-protein-alanine N-acetyltransferase